MDETKPKNIKAVGLGIIAASILIIFSNGSFSLVLNIMGGIEAMIGYNSGIIHPGLFAFWNNLYKLSLFMVLMGITFLVGGILLFRLNRYARIILISLSITFTIILVFMIINLALININNDLNLFEIFAYVYSVIFIVAAMLVLIIYLNRKQIRKYFG